MKMIFRANLWCYAGSRSQTCNWTYYRCGLWSESSWSYSRLWSSRLPLPWSQNMHFTWFWSKPTQSEW